MPDDSRPTSLFTPTTNDRPIVFDADSLPRRPYKPLITFRFNAGEISISKGLFLLLAVADCRRVRFVNYRGQGYITRTDQGGFWLNLRERDTSGMCSADISSKAFVQKTMRELGHGPDEVIGIPVASHQVTAVELGLDPAQFAYPLYRIVTDQKIKKV